MQERNKTKTKNEKNSPIDLEGIKTEFEDEFLASLKGHLKHSWDKLRKDDKDLLQDIAKDAKDLYIKKLKGEDVETELNIVNASLANMAVAKYVPVEKVFWFSVQNAAKFVITAFTKAGIEALKRGI